MKMQFANVNGVRTKPTKSLTGTCLICGADVISKCGSIRIHHWAHKSRQVCDPWWENQTQWHKEWKDHFPAEWQEIGFIDSKRVKHIADVKRPDGLVVEVQHSHIHSVERRERETAHKTMIWIVDGLRLKRDFPGFEDALRGSRFIHNSPPIFSVETNESSLLQKWAGSDKSVYFDFGDKNPAADKVESESDPILWRMDPSSTDQTAFLTPIFRSKLVSDVLNLALGQASVSGLVSRIKLSQARRQPVPRASIPSGFQRYLAAKGRRRANRRL